MNRPDEIIRREIVEHGVLPFARFMELALYCPNSGYYETKKDNPGRRGDFYTSVSAGELFGRLLAFQFAEWLGEWRSAECGRWIVESGAHDGTLAKDIMSWLQSARPELFGPIEYCIIEPSARRREWQNETLKNFAPRVRWFPDWENLSRVTGHASLHGVIFSNELLDAMPVHRLGWDARSKQWFEWGVTLEGEKFVWARSADGPPACSSEPPNQFADRLSALRNLPASLLAVLPDGYTIETSPAAESWWRAAAGVLGQGKLMTIDYGLTGDELFSPGRTRGTLRAYFRHHATDDVLANPGEQDLTTHVNFSAIQSVGEACGLKTEALSTQAQFLTKVADKIFKNPQLFGEWAAKQTRQFQTLTHPEHLGHALRVLIQSKPGAP
ncbi:MAG: SAM-dependent methyltransferase [Verrucomicrobiia bacterium]